MSEDKKFRDEVARLSKEVLGFELQFNEPSLENMVCGRALTVAEVFEHAKAEKPLWVIRVDYDDDKDYNGPVKSYYDEAQNTLIFNFGCMGMDLYLDKLTGPMPALNEPFHAKDEYAGWLIYEAVPMTGCITTDIRENAPCTKCGAKAGEDCRTPSGRKSQAMGGHAERSAEFRRLFPNYLPKIIDNISGADFIQRLLDDNEK